MGKLTDAVRSGDIKEVESLLSGLFSKYRNKPLINEEKFKGKPALYLAIELGHKEIALALIKAGADVDYQVGKLKWTPLFVAALNGHLTVVEALIKAKVDVNLTRDTRGNPTLYCSTRRPLFCC